MKTRTAALLVAVTASMVAAAWFADRALMGISRAAAAPPPPASPQPVQIVNGETVVTLGTDEQRAGHIGVAPLDAGIFTPERTAYATVIDLQPLFELRNRAAAARAELRSARAQLGASLPQYERNRSLFESDRDVSRKTLEISFAVMRTDRAKLQAAQANESSIEAILRQQYGGALASAVQAPVSDVLRRLLTGQAVVVRVTAIASDGVFAPMQIAVADVDGHPLTARKLSVSPQTDPLIQGSPYLYLTDSPLPVGMRTTLRVPWGDKPMAGLRIPPGAVVWYGGKPWVYVRTAVDRFTRRAVAPAAALDGGVIVTSGFRAGDEVVVRGAQLLLSEELLPRGISAQCKDPPECDD